jgi:hypothetical protein
MSTLDTKCGALSLDVWVDLFLYLSEAHMRTAAAICAGIVFLAGCTDSTGIGESTSGVAASVMSASEDPLITIDFAGYSIGPGGAFFNDPCSGDEMILTGSRTITTWTPRGFTTSHVIGREVRKINCSTGPYVGGSIGLWAQGVNGWEWLGSVAANVQRRGIIENVPSSANVMVVANAASGYELLNPGAWTEEQYPGSGIYVRYMSGAEANGLQVGFIAKPTPGGPGGGGAGCEQTQFICP